MQYHIVDSEWKENYLSPEELETLLTQSRSLDPELKTIITVSVRHFGSMKKIKKLTKLSEKYENLGLNLVAGNKAYLTTREQEKSALKALKKAIKLVRKNSEDSPVFVGTEGLVKTVSKLVCEYEIKPFFVLDRNLEAQINKIWKMNNECCIAVYAPYLVFAEGDNASDMVIKSLVDYVLRRKWVADILMKKGHDIKRVRALLKGGQEDACQIKDRKLKDTLINMMRKFSIFGNENTVTRTLQTLKKVSIISGLPIKEEERQVKEFAKIIRKVNRL